MITHKTIDNNMIFNTEIVQAPGDCCCEYLLLNSASGKTIVGHERTRGRSDERKGMKLPAAMATSRLAYAIRRRRELEHPGPKHQVPGIQVGIQESPLSSMRLRKKPPIRPWEREEVIDLE